MGKDSELIKKYGTKRVLFECAQRGLEVFAPSIDTKGVDIIIQTNSSDTKEIQVITRVPKEGKNFDIPLSYLSDKDNSYIACYFFKSDDVWIIPSNEFVKLNELDPKDNPSARVTIDKKNIKELKGYFNNYDQLQ
jgi:hypothetical protein